MIRPTVAHVDLSALRANFAAIAEYVQGRSERSRTRPPGVIAVVKANAYGHGASRVGLALAEAGAQLLACADIEEGIALRRAGVETPILVFGALGVSDVDGLLTHDLIPTLSSPMAARTLQAAAARHRCRLACHLKIDTGMNRLGFRHDNLTRTMPEVVAAANLDVVAVYTHFATSDDPVHGLMTLQLARFERVCAALPGLGIRPRYRHTAASAAILRDERVWFDFVRPGLLLYGIVPPPLSTTLPLRPVLGLESRVVAIKGLRVGETVGYGGRFRAEHPSEIAVVPAGYADGLDTRLAGRGVALVRGRRVPIVGSVCMDMIVLDVTGLGAAPGDEVVLLGTQGDERIDVCEMAAAIDTIPYEIPCRIGSRIERIYNP